MRKGPATTVCGERAGWQSSEPDDVFGMDNRWICPSHANASAYLATVSS